MSAGCSSVAPTVPAPAPVAACGCGCSYALDEWMRLLRRPWQLGGASLEIAECRCGSTIAMPIEVAS